MKIANMKRSTGSKPLNVKRESFEKRRQRAINVCASTNEAKNTMLDSIELYPIKDACLLPIVSSPHKMLLLATLYLKNDKKKVSYDGTDNIPLCRLSDTNTAEFVSDLINPRVFKYEIGCTDSAYLYQLVLDNYEWRTFIYYVLIMDIPESESVMQIDERKKQVIIEKRAPFRSTIFLNVGRHIVCLCHALKMIQRKAVEDLTSVKEGTYDVAITDNQFVFRVKTSLPPIQDIDALKERFTGSLRGIISHKLTVLSI